MCSNTEDEHKSLKQLLYGFDGYWRIWSTPDKSEGAFNYYVTFDNKRKKNTSRVRLMNHLLIQDLRRHSKHSFKNINVTNLRLFGGMSRWKTW